MNEIIDGRRAWSLCGGLGIRTQTPTGSFSGRTWAAAQWPAVRRAFSTNDQTETALPSEGGEFVGRGKAGRTESAPTASIIDEAVRKITLNLGLKTEVLVAHGIGIQEALHRQHQLHLGMLLAARRKAIRQTTIPGTGGIMVSELLRKTIKRRT